MSYCPSSLPFSEAHSDNRVKAACRTLGEGVVKRVLAFALFLMGAKREDIAQHLSIPLGTLFSLLTRISKQGLGAVEDRRHRHSEFLPLPASRTPGVEVTSTESGIDVRFGSGGPTVSIPISNVLQIKVLLLTLLQNRLIDRPQVARVLGYSSTHIARMVRQLEQDDVPALLDKRRGQQDDYRITPEVKAELVQQFAVDIIARGRTSGEAISAELRDRCAMTIPARTVRYHLARMGLPAIRHSLPQLLEAVKKTSSGSSKA